MTLLLIFCLFIFIFILGISIFIIVAAEDIGYKILASSWILFDILGLIIVLIYK